MKARVLTPFVDKHTGAFHRVGDLLDISGERYQEIASAGNFVEALDAPEAPVEKTAKNKRTAKSKRKG